MQRAEEKQRAIVARLMTGSSPTIVSPTSDLSPGERNNMKAKASTRAPSNLPRLAPRLAPGLAPCLAPCLSPYLASCLASFLIGRAFESLRGQPALARRLTKALTTKCNDAAAEKSETSVAFGASSQTDSNRLDALDGSKFLRSVAFNPATTEGGAEVGDVEVESKANSEAEEMEDPKKLSA